MKNKNFDTKNSNLSKELETTLFEISELESEIEQYAEIIRQKELHIAQILNTSSHSNQKSYSVEKNSNSNSPKYNSYENSGLLNILFFLNFIILN